MVDGVNLVQNKTGPGEKLALDFDVPIKQIIETQDMRNLLENFSDARLANPEQAELTDASMMIARGERNAADGNLQVSYKKENYIEAFIHNPVVTKIFPDIMNWLNIGGNALSLATHAFGFSDGAKNVAKKIGSLTTKSFMIANSVINIVERCYSKNFLSALGYLNDIFIAGTVDQDDTYLARGTASGTYNMANSLAMSMGKKKFSSIDDHVTSTFKAYSKFFKNLFSPNVVKNFMNHENGMWAIFGGIFSNIGALSWLFSGKTKIPTLVRDVAGVMMDIEQLNPGHLKAGQKNYFFSGLSLAVGTVADLFTRLTPQFKDMLVPLTFIFDGLGRHLLRLHQNERELNKGAGLA